LDLDRNRAVAPLKDAATVVLVRDAKNVGRGIEIFCVERNKASQFLGGAVVFPGGKLDPADASEAWLDHATEPCTPQASAEPFARDAAHLRALAIAAARETLEEAAILLALPRTASGARAIADRDILALRSRTNALYTFLQEHALLLDLASLYPFARWVTPAEEPRRFDTRFYVAVAPPGQSGAHDEYETMASFWASPRDVLHRFDAGEITLYPPTHCTLEVLATCTNTADVIALARTSSLDPICPKLVMQNTSTVLVLPGDPEHDVREVRVSGPSRYVLCAGRWCAEHAR